MMNLSKTYQEISFLREEKYPLMDIQEDELYIFHFSFDTPFDDKIWNLYLSILSEEFRRDVYKYRRWQDKYNCLLGKLMVYMGYQIFCGDQLEFDRFLKNPYGKPYIYDTSLNFNISHSGNTVVCIFSKQAIGIDIEEVKEIEYTLFDNVFSKVEMEQIQKQGLLKFYEYWTKKEAVIKAIGKGMSIPLEEIKINDASGSFKEVVWYTKSYCNDNIYYSIASKQKVKNIKQVQIKF